MYHRESRRTTRGCAGIRGHEPRILCIGVSMSTGRQAPSPDAINSPDVVSSTEKLRKAA